MSNQSERELPSGIVKFTITREKMKNILSKEYNENVESFSVEDEGISISLRVPEKVEKEEPEEEEYEGEEFGEEPEEEEEFEEEPEEENQLF